MACVTLHVCLSGIWSGCNNVTRQLFFFKSNFHFLCSDFQMCASAQADKHFLYVSVNILEKYISLVQLGKPRKFSGVFQMW